MKMPTGLSDEQEQKLKKLAHQNKSELEDYEITTRVEWALKRKYQRPEWALFYEVPGKNGKRADAIAYNLYPSRNFKTIGFEIKASRGDWKKELNDIEKADWFVGQCQEWYIVAGRKGIVRESELPDGWGLLEMKGGGKLYEVKESNLTEHQDRPMDKEFWARAVQKSMKKVTEMKREQNQIERDAYRKGKKEGKEEGDVSREQKILMEKGEKFEKLADNLDTHISRYTDNEEAAGKINKASEIVERIEEDGYGSLVRKLERFKNSHSSILSAVNEMEDILEDLGAETEIKSEEGLEKFQS